MASVTSLGSGSGLDLEGLVTKLMASESLSVTRLQTKEATFTSKISQVGQFTSLVSAVQASVQALGDGSKVNGITATSSNASVFSVSAKSTASMGMHSIAVTQLAQGQRLVSASGFTSTTSTLSASADNVTSATISIKFGSTTGTNGALKESDPAQTPLTVDVTPTDGKITLTAVRDAINAKGGGVTASLVKESDSSTRLVLTDSNTGANNAFSVDVALKNGTTELYNSATLGSTTSTGFSSLVYHPGETLPAPVYEVKNAAADAKLSLDGVDVTRSSNTITDLLDDVTLTLTGTTASGGTAANLQISRDSSGISSLLSSFVSSYNALQTTITSLTSYNATTQKGGALQGDSTIRSIQSQMRSMLGSTFGAAGNSSIKTLSDLGVNFQKDGTLKLNSAKLIVAVNSHLDEVQSLLGSYDKTANATAPVSAQSGFSYKLDKLASGMLGSAGLIQTKIDGMNRSVKSIDAQIVRENLRLTHVEALYRKQFAALDTAVASMKSTSTYLTQQLASIASITSGTSSSN